LPYLTGQVEKSPRRGFFYFDDDGDLVGLRLENWKVVFMEQRAQGTLRIWADGCVRGTVQIGVPGGDRALPGLFQLT